MTCREVVHMTFECLNHPLVLRKLEEHQKQDREDVRSTKQRWLSYMPLITQTEITESLTV